MRFLPGYITWRLHPSGYRHTAKVLKPYHDKFRGCRCIVIGNGPSLNEMDLSVLEKEFTFGLNRIYLLFDKLEFETTFLVSINKLVLKQFADEITDNQSLKIFNWASRDYFHVGDDLILQAIKPSKNINGRALDGFSINVGSVTNRALELAYYMGFEEVILIGVDHDYSEEGPSGLTVVSEGPDKDHFHNDYFGKGISWQLPDYKLFERGYRQNKKLFESDGRKIVDATIGGKLQVYQKVPFKKYLSNSTYINQSDYKDS